MRSVALVSQSDATDSEFGTLCPRERQSSTRVGRTPHLRRKAASFC